MLCLAVLIRFWIQKRICYVKFTPKKQAKTKSLRPKQLISTRRSANWTIRHSMAKTKKSCEQSKNLSLITKSCKQTTKAATIQSKWRHCVNSWWPSKTSTNQKENPHSPFKLQRAWAFNKPTNMPFLATKRVSPMFRWAASKIPFWMTILRWNVVAAWIGISTIKFPGWVFLNLTEETNFIRWKLLASHQVKSLSKI